MSKWICLLAFCRVADGRPFGGTSESPFSALPTSLNQRGSTIGCSAAEASPPVTKPCNVIDFGATGDGKTDDSAAIAKAAITCQVVYFPSGLFLVTETINIPSGGPFSVMGDGWGSNILWSHDGHLFHFNGSVASSMIRNIAVSSITTVKSPNSTAFNFAGGLAKSIIQQVLFFGQGDIPDVPEKATLIGSAINMGPVSDTVSVVDCIVWFCQGVAIQIGQGSEVRIEGGRLIGSSPAAEGRLGIGVYITGE
jgi:hypothetical protein